MNRIINTILAALLIAFISLAWFINQNEHQKRLLKDQVIEISKVKYGLFNVDEWKSILAEIISTKIDDFNLNEDNRDEVKAKVSKFLYAALEDFEGNFKETNRSKSWFGISYKNVIAGSTSLFERLRDYVPELSNQVVTYLDDPENRENLKRYIEEKIDQYADETFSEVDYTQLNAVLEQGNYLSKYEAVNGLYDEINQIQSDNQKYQYSLVGIVLLLTVALLIKKNLTPANAVLLTLLSLVVLYLGLSLPMIDIDARISEMSFTLLGEPIRFTDQVLYYKSKSILEVVSLMLTQGKVDLAAVGVLVLCFSVLFPVSKLICIVLYSISSKMKDSKWVNVIVFKTGKWSMADVMVVAIFMAYIGFSGIITEQLKQLEDIAVGFDILTTNKSTLQFGFYMFTSFVILSMLVSQRLKNYNW